MDKTHGIIIFGANGSGKTTLGRELAGLLGFRHMDIEDYYFEKSEIPYTVKRSRKDCLELMLFDIEKYGSFVITAVTGDFGDEIQRLYKLAVGITAPHEVRMSRIKQRSREKYGDRVCKGGDMYEQEQQFFDFAAARSLSGIGEWAETLTCPVMYVDGMVDFHINAAAIAERFSALIKDRDEMGSIIR